MKVWIYSRLISPRLRNVLGIRLSQGLSVELLQHNSAFFSSRLTATLTTHVRTPTACRHGVRIRLEYWVCLILWCLVVPQLLLRVAALPASAEL